MGQTLTKVPTLRRPAGIDWVRDRIPGETATPPFRHLLEKQQARGEQVVEAVKAHRTSLGMTMR